MKREPRKISALTLVGMKKEQADKLVLGLGLGLRRRARRGKDARENRKGGGKRRVKS